MVVLVALFYSVLRHRTSITRILLWVEGGDLSIGAVERAVCDFGPHVLS